MKIKFSRHAKRRAQLYKIPEAKIRDILASVNLHRGVQEIIRDVVGFQYL